MINLELTSEERIALAILINRELGENENRVPRLAPVVLHTTVLGIREKLAKIECETINNS